MSKFKNELDVKRAGVVAAKALPRVEEILKKNPTLQKIVTGISKNKSIVCCIFARSIAFRIGKSSIKDVQGYPTGFKSDFGGKNAVDFFSSIPTLSDAPSKSQVVQIAALYALAKFPERVLTVSDKTEADESEQVLKIQDKLAELVSEYGSVRVKMGKQTYEVDSISQVANRAKADMTLNMNGKPVIFISHKKGKVAGNFQQYGGSADLGITNKEDAKKYPEIYKFLTDVDSIFLALGQLPDNNGRHDFNSLNKGSNFARIIKDQTVANYVMFGNDFASGVPGMDNCSILIDGDILFVKEKGKANVFTLDGSYHSELNPCLSGKNATRSTEDVYTPAMFVYKSESQGLNQAGFSNARFAIWPNNKVIKSYRKQFDAALAATKDRRSANFKQMREKLLK